MARVEILATVDKIVSSNLQPASGASVQVNVRSTGTPTTVYAAETGGTTVSNPLTTDANGRINGWIEEGSYVLAISGGGITSYNQPFEAVRGDGVTNLATGVVSFAKLDASTQQAIFSTGDLKASARSAVPTGWLLCDGSAVSRTGATAALFAAIGTTYGSGDGSTTFNLPDLRGRAAIGVDSGGTRVAGATLGASGGAATVALATGELPSHSHGPGTLATNSQGTHAHSFTTGLMSANNAHSHGFPYFAPGRQGGTSGWAKINANFFSSGPWSGNAWSMPYFSGDAGIVDMGGTNLTDVNHSHSGSTDSVGAHTHSVTTGTTATAGSGTAHQNMPPYQVVNWFIKT